MNWTNSAACALGACIGIACSASGGGTNITTAPVGASPAVAADSPSCLPEADAPAEGSTQRLYAVKAAADENMDCIMPGGWALRVGEGEEGTTEFIDCAHAVAEAARAYLSKEKYSIVVDDERPGFVRIHFQARTPLFFEILYRANPQRGTKALALWHYSEAGEEKQPGEYLTPLAFDLRAAFFCRRTK